MQPPPTPGLADFTIIMECTPEIGSCYALYTLCISHSQHWFKKRLPHSHAQTKERFLSPLKRTHPQFKDLVWHFSFFCPEDLLTWLFFPFPSCPVKLLLWFDGIFTTAFYFEKLYDVVLVLFVNEVPYDYFTLETRVRLTARAQCYEDIKFSDGTILKPIFYDFFIVSSKRHG